MVAMFTMLCAGCGLSHPAGSIPKVIVLGVDGMDPAFVERHWDALPHLRQLRDDGRFGKLATTTPPQSPVAWSTFITGLPPSATGIYDFVHRDPVTLQPYSSLSRTKESRFHLPIGPFDFPLSQSHVVSLRQGKPFWQTLSLHHIPATVIRIPANYPPVPFGRAISGMGVPDLSGTLGTFTYFTDDPLEYTHSVLGGRVVKVVQSNGHSVLLLEGPPNTLRKNREVANAELILDVDPERPLARLSVDNALTVLREGEWSGWIGTEIRLVRYIASVRGIFRVYVKQLHPRLEIYVSAVNADPSSPSLPVSYPDRFSHDVAAEIGPFFTLGIPEDTSALRQQVLTHSEFRRQVQNVFEDEQRLLKYALRHFERGLLFYYLSTIDQNSHILWGRYETELLGVYQEVDRLVGEVRQSAPGADLVVMSDHGFTSFDRAVHLNTWLHNRGFLATNEPLGTRATVEGADWASTEAYAMGLNGLYLNSKGREKFGAVEPGAPREALLANLKHQLTAWRDPVNGRQVVEAVDEVFGTAKNEKSAPDLIVGYAAGYRASWQTALGGIPESELEDNQDAWIGDHCVNPSVVPGVLFTTNRSLPQPRSLQEVTAFVLQRFGF